MPDTRERVPNGGIWSKCVEQIMNGIVAMWMTRYCNDLVWVSEKEEMRIRREQRHPSSKSCFLTAR